MGLGLSWLTRSSFVTVVLVVMTGGACASEHGEPNQIDYEDGYRPGTEAECAPLRAALSAPSSEIVASVADPGPRSELEVGLSERLRVFLERQCYKLPGWALEDGVHLTGSEAEGDTHGWVRVAYSPEVVAWIRAGRPAGEVPANAILVKERFRKLGAEESGPFALIGWQPMVRRAEDSQDGWFWGDISQETARHGERTCDPNTPLPAATQGSSVPDCRPESGFGAPCLRCHASAPSDFTYAQPTHLPEATGGDRARRQIFYGYRERWRDEDAVEESYGYASYRSAPPSGYVSPHPDRASLPAPLAAPDPALVALFFAGSPEIVSEGPSTFPPRLFDSVFAPSGALTHAATFFTSNQCWGCHSGVPHVAKDKMDYATGTLVHYTPGASMLAPAGVFDDGRARYADVSPYGEWSVSMMGLAGKDPVFFAQREWEAQHRSECADDITHLCYGCHGVAGRRQLDLDHPGRKFGHDIVYAGANHPDGKYGALARDGVTCMVCHGMSGEGLGTNESYTGAFTPGPPGTIRGPYDDVRERPMRSALGLTPAGDGAAREILKSGALCGSCHAVKLPVYRVGTCEPLGIGYEQATYLEWRNSVYRKNDAFVTDEGASGSEPATCQDCHMPHAFRGDPLERRIASVEDADFPKSNLSGLPNVHADVAIAARKPYSRHTLNGINLFSLGMFAQFPRELGISDYDFMTNQYGEPIALQMATAIEAGKTLATEHTAKVSITRVETTADDLEVSVLVENLAGHKFPTGVSFRRAVLELVVEGADGKALFRSGSIDARGMVVGGDGATPIASELSTTAPELHHQVITSPEQAQIYEERYKDSSGVLSTSFLGIADTVKDNRLLPRGFKRIFPSLLEGGVMPPGVMPDGVEGDPEYEPEAGACGCDRVLYRIPLGVAGDAVRVYARLYYQSIPPYYLRDRFTTQHAGPDARRLAQLVTRLRTDVPDGGIQGWKVFVAGAERAL